MVTSSSSAARTGALRCSSITSEESVLVNENNFQQEPNESFSMILGRELFIFFLKPRLSRPRKGNKKALFISSLLDFGVGRKKNKTKTHKKGHFPMLCHEAVLHGNGKFACVCAPLSTNPKQIQTL